MKAILPMLFCFTLFGCGAGDGTGLDQDGQPIDPDGGDPVPQPPADPNAVQPTLASIQEKVLTPICTQCHVGSGAPLGLRMDDLETSQANLINVDSATNPLFKRVEPGNAEQSFFYLKIIGDPSAGNQMPLGQTPLPADTQETIKDWINSGAPIDGNQATAAAKRLPSGQQEVVIAVRFSQPIAPEVIGPDDIELLSKSNQERLLYQPDEFTLEWINERNLIIKLAELDPQQDSISIRFNQPNLSSVISQKGIWLDGDYDGYAGGVAEYEFTIDQ